MSLLVRPGPFIPAVSLIDPPLIPSSYDDEFDGAGLDASWSLLGGNWDNVNAIDPYTGFASNNRYSINSWRSSWFMVQPDTSATEARFRKLITPPTDCFIWTRGSFFYRGGAQANNDSSMGMILADNDAFATNNAVSIYLNESDANTVQVEAVSIASGVATSLGVTTSLGGTGRAQAFQYTGIQKIGTTYHFWAATENGCWLWINSVINSATFNRVLFRLQNVTAGTPGNGVQGIDFFRFVSGKYLP